jgi:hypothetical protein
MAVKMYTGNDKLFLDSCEKAGIKPTARQRKKWENKRGKAYKASLA